MAKPRKPTPNQAAWAKEVKRLEREMKRAQRLGKSVPAGFIPETPTRITQKQLNLIRSKTLKPKKQKPEAESRKPPRSKGEEKRRKPRTAGVAQEEPRKGRTRHPSDPELNKEKDRVRSVIYRARKRGYEAPSLAEILAAKPGGLSDLDYLRTLHGNELYSHFRYQIARDAAGNPIYQTGVERRAEENWARSQLGFAKHPGKTGAPPLHDPALTNITPNLPQEPEFEPYHDPGNEEILDAVSQYYAHLMQQLDEFEVNENWTDAYKQKKGEDKASIHDFVKTIVEKDGAAMVALRIASSSEDLKRHLDVIMYHSDEGDIAYSYGRVATIVAGRSLTRAEAEAITEDN